MYYVFFHPLAKVPGPKLYAFWDLPMLYHLLRGDWQHRLKQLHDEYGPAVRYTPNNVSFTTPGAWKTIYSHRVAGQETFIKDPLAYRRSFSGTPHIVNSNGDVHRRQRRLLAHAFSEKALRGQEDIMKRYIDLLISKLREKSDADEVLDIVKWYNFTTFDLIGDLAFGQPFDCLESGGYHPWVAMIFQNIKLSVYTIAMMRHPVLKPLVQLIVPSRLVRSQREHYMLTERTVKRRLESGNVTREDFMSYILRHNDEKGMSPSEIVENANVMIIAGSETTATQLSGTTFYLLTNPDKYAKLVAEIRSAFSSEEDITLLTVNNLEYMNAVFEEGFRMCKSACFPGHYQSHASLVSSHSPYRLTSDPPVPPALSRRTPDNGEYIEGYWIPGKVSPLRSRTSLVAFHLLTPLNNTQTGVGVPMWASFRSERNFRDADKFVPERWLGEPEYAHDARDVMQPFSIGPRNCIGKKYVSENLLCHICLLSIR